MRVLQGGEDVQDALSCGSLFAKEITYYILLITYYALSCGSLFAKEITYYILRITYYILCLKLRVALCKRATNYRALVWKMSSKE